MAKFLNGKTIIASIALVAACGAALLLSDIDALKRPSARAPSPAPPVLEINPQAMSSGTPAPQPSSSTAAPTDNSDIGRMTIKRILPIEGPIKYGEWHWNEEGVPKEGEVLITVDLEARVISVFRDGYEIGAAAVLLGSAEKPTPTGVFPISEKKQTHTSNLYDAPMPYMQRLTNDGIALHATNVALGYASRGCVGMPKEFAQKVFNTTKIGDRVIITDGKRVTLGDAIS